MDDPSQEDKPAVLPYATPSNEAAERTRVGCLYTIMFAVVGVIFGIVLAANIGEFMERQNPAFNVLTIWLVTVVACIVFGVFLDQLDNRERRKVRTAKGQSGRRFGNDCSTPAAQ